MSDVTINQVLAQMRTHAAMAAGQVDRPAAPEQVGGPAFSEVMTSALRDVNARSQEAGALTEAFTRGDPGVDLARVMIASEKSGLAFEAVAQTRNRLLGAYREIMSMPL